MEKYLVVFSKDSVKSGSCEYCIYDKGNKPLYKTDSKDELMIVLDLMNLQTVSRKCLDENEQLNGYDMIIGLTEKEQ